MKDTTSYFWLQLKYLTRTRIGNSEFEYADRLRNPVNDVRAIDSTIQELNFGVVTLTKFLSASNCAFDPVIWQATTEQ